MPNSKELEQPTPKIEQHLMNAVTIQTDFKPPKGYDARFKVLSPSRVRIVLTETPPKAK